MESIFIDLMQTLTKEKLKGPIKPNKDFEKIVERVESIFNQNNKEYLKLSPNKFCPIVATGEKYKYVFLGLNPHDDGESGELKHITTWERLSEYHVPSNLYGDNIFSRVLYNKAKNTYQVVKYYQNISILINSLEKGELVKWSDFRSGCTPLETKEKYLKMIENNPIGVVEMIPFASKGISPSKDKLQKLMEFETGFENYISSVFDTIITRTTDDAWIICNGSLACDAFEIFFGTRASKLIALLDRKSDKKYSLYDLNGKKVLMLHNFLRKIGALNSYNQIASMIDDVTNVIKSKTYLTNK